MNTQHKNRIRRHKRVRAKIAGTSERPRLTVFRSNSHIYAQLIDDAHARTLTASSDMVLDTKEIAKKNPTDIAREVGKDIAKRAREHRIGRIVFDRGGYAYHGRVRGVAEGAREGGLQF